MEARITAWFATGLRREAIRIAKKNRRLREHELLILNQPLKNESLDPVEMVEIIPGKANIAAEVEDSIFVQEALTLLTHQQQKVIKAIILDGRAEQQVADEMGISKQAVNRMKQRALSKLRKNYVLDEPTGKCLIQDRQLP